MKSVKCSSRPEIGRPFHAEPGLRELVIASGDSGCVALYRYAADEDTVYVRAFRDQRQAGH